MESSRWSKHEGAVPGVDYPGPPAVWGQNGVNDMVITQADKEGVWKAFEERALSTAELAALREVTISRKENRDGRVGGNIGVGKTTLLSSDASSTTAQSEDNSSSLPTEFSARGKLLNGTMYRSG